MVRPGSWRRRALLALLLLSLDASDAKKKKKKKKATAPDPTPPATSTPPPPKGPPPPPEPVMLESVTLATAFSPQECADIAAASLALQRREGGVGGVGAQSHARRASTQWLPRDDEAFGWVYDRVVNLTVAANEGAWRLAAIDGAQDIQISTYKAEDRGYYNVSAAHILTDSPLSPALTSPRRCPPVARRHLADRG